MIKPYSADPGSLSGGDSHHDVIETLGINTSLQELIAIVNLTLEEKLHNYRQDMKNTQRSAIALRAQQA